MATKTVKKWHLHQYTEIWEITKWKEGCVYETKKVGFARSDDLNNYPTDRFIHASVSTSYMEGDLDYVVLEPYLSIDAD
jgi:hypothetical protein